MSDVFKEASCKHYSTQKRSDHSHLHLQEVIFAVGWGCSRSGYHSPASFGARSSQRRIPRMRLSSPGCQPYASSGQGKNAFAQLKIRHQRVTDCFFSKSKLRRGSKGMQPAQRSVLQLGPLHDFIASKQPAGAKVPFLERLVNCRYDCACGYKLNLNFFQDALGKGVCQKQREDVAAQFYALRCASLLLRRRNESAAFSILVFSRTVKYVEKF
jgi:hypothetical protein